MNRRINRRRLAALVAVPLALAIGGVAFAYWTAGGTGTGSATVGTVSDITVNQTTVLAAMYPGDSPQTISGTFTNTNSGSVYVTSVTVSIGSVTKADGAPSGTCDATDFTLTNATAPVGAQVAPGTSVGSWTGPTIQFNDKAGSNQDACKNATVTLAYAIP